MGKKNKEVVEKGVGEKKEDEKKKYEEEQEKKRNRCSRIMCRGVKEGGLGEREGEEIEEVKECWYHTIIMKWKIM